VRSYCETVCLALAGKNTVVLSLQLPILLASMVRTLMSSENSVAGESDALCKAKEKVSIQNSLINFNARNLKRLKESTSRLSSNSPNLNGVPPTGSCASDSEAPSALDDDIRLQEVSRGRGCSNGL